MVPGIEVGTGWPSPWIELRGGWPYLGYVNKGRYDHITKDGNEGRRTIPGIEEREDVTGIEVREDVAVPGIVIRNERRCEYSGDRSEGKCGHTWDRNEGKCGYTWDRNEGKCGYTWDRNEGKCDNTWDRSEEQGVPYTAWAPSHLLAGSHRFAPGPEYLSRDPTLLPQLHRYHTHYNLRFPSHAISSHSGTFISGKISPEERCRS